MKNTRDIDFLMFTVKENEKSIADVMIDLKAREYKIEKTDLYGQILEPEIGGKLRRTKIADFLSELTKMNVCNFPLKEKNTLPIHLKSATLMYRVENKMYFTDGDNQKNLAQVHKAIEHLLNTTFGAYKFY